MEKLVLDGTEFVRAASAADELGYTRDYVGQLCRAGKIRAHLVGRTWYVDQEQLRTHKREKKRTSKIKARQQLRESLKQVKGSDDKAYESRIRYEEDDKELIPEVKKLAVETEHDSEKKRSSKKKKKKSKESKKKEPDYTVENKGEKIVMSGTLDVQDASEEDELFDDGATVLHAKVVKVKPDEMQRPKKRSVKETKAISVKELGESEAFSSSDRPHDEPDLFRKKLALLDEQDAKEDKGSEERGKYKIRPVAAAPQVQVHGNSKKAVHSAAWPFYGVILAVLLIASTVALLESSWRVSDAEEGNLLTDYAVDVADVTAYLKTLINP